ncbi:HlyD family secretion protein [Alkalimonas amylolytica]|uniref:HlyD family secretion protein n=1 Tax=Alkalimonas amylolytica TaxID=152573 RepID=A0A1H4AUD2_ALKAM|nr:biotin/lipoyl-binding protein [Alkalimonas amylolytica]SEA39490.1 HlyD family secretion protein [Alkalimonas amylolytica]
MPLKKIAVAIAAVSLLLALFWWLWPAPQPELLHGDVEVREIRLASKIPGRILKLHVQEGDQVQAGQLLFELDSPELNAKLAQAEAAEAATKALQDEAEAGLRSEEIEMARLDWQRALVQQNLYQSTLNRMRNLHEEGLVSQQQLEETQAKWQASVDQASAAEARYTMAASGAREEQLRAVQAQNRRAAAAVAEVEAHRQETRMLAPVAGEVASIVVQQGELAPAGYPIITLVDPTDVWVVFNIREDKLNALVPGTTFEAKVPALNETLDFRVSKLNALPSFASWKQVRGTPGYDLKTFQLEARPIQPEQKLRAGMTVILALED